MSGPAVLAHSLPASTHAALSIVNTDTFCAACGFNLQTQPVWKDQELGILLARCPECGAHHPAGVRTTAPNAWLGRLSLLGTVVWVMLWLGFILAGFLGIFIAQVATLEGVVIRSYETRDGRAVLWNSGGGAIARGWELAEGNTPVAESDVRLVQKIPSWMSRNTSIRNQWGYYAEIPPVPFFILVAFFGGGTLFLGVTLSVATWFWPTRRRMLMLAMPLLAAILTTAMLGQFGDRPYFALQIPRAGPRFDIIGLVVVTTLQILVLAVAVFFGRAIARSTVRAVLPPRARQYFGFLWLCDGKAPPIKS